MKRSLAKTVWLFIYLNFWYIPLLVFLLGVKISLISLLVASVDNSRRLTAEDGDKILATNAIVKMVHENLKENQEYLKAHVHLHEHRMKNTKREIRAKDIMGHDTGQVKVKENGGGMGWAAELRQSNQPLTNQDWAVLANLEQSNIEPSSSNRTDRESIWLILNDVPSGGGEIISQLLEDFQEENEFKHLEHEYRTPWPRFLLEEEQKSLVTWFEYQHLPRSYDRHFYFVNFTKFQQYVFENPIYINMVSDPVTRLRSVFKAKRADRQKSYEEVERREQIKRGSGKAWLTKDFDDCVIKGEDPECSFVNGTSDFTLSVPFFCGQVNGCVILNNKWAIQSAKFNIEKYYSVVGVLEKLKESLEVLENYVPRFFFGASAKFEQLSDMKREIEKRDGGGVDEEDETELEKKVRLTLEKKLPFEFELFDFIKARLDKQVSALASIKNMQENNFINTATHS